MTSTVTPIEKVTSTISPKHTLTEEPTRTPSPSKTHTPEPTKTPTPPTPTLPPTPDSLIIAFTRDDTIWVWQDGVETPLAEAPFESLDLLVNTNMIALSDDGQKIAFTKGDDEIWSINTDGTDERLLAGEEFFKALGVDRPYKMKWLPKSHMGASLEL